MNINDILKKDLMILDLKARTKESAIDEMIKRLVDEGAVNDFDTFKEGIMNRESQTSTGLGDGIAMPHSKNRAVTKPAVLFAKSSSGVNYNALDGKPVEVFFMIAAPEGGDNLHLEVLASLARKLVDKDVVNALKTAQTPEDVQLLFEESSKEEAVTENQAQERGEKFVVAVTACPTGIAHTYMAEDALKKKATEMGVEIRVETNGTDGAKNKLTADEIRRADGVIVAADKKVDMARFDGKPLIQRPVSEGINKSEELITRAVSGNAPIYSSDGSSVSDDSQEGDNSSIGQSIYKDVMNGISHMLPFVVGGGILLAISFLFEAQLGEDSILFTSLNTIGGSAFEFLIPILAGYIAFSIADRPGLLPGMAGGLLAVQSDAGFLGGLVAGFVAGYVMLWIKKLLRNVPKTFEGLKSILLYPVLGLLAVGLLMFFLIGPFFAVINNAMLGFLENLGTGNAVLLGAVLGGMMAVDMGGPVNKAAYAFSIGVFGDTGNGSLMAAVMVGGMIPPLAIAISTVLFKSKYTDLEKSSGLSNFVLGASFITEGAIPFAAADPLRVIGSSVLGAAIGGGLTQLWDVAIPAPHGGLFVVGIGENPMLFVAALLIGSFLSAILLGFWKPKIEQLDVKVQTSELS